MKTHRKAAGPALCGLTVLLLAVSVTPDPVRGQGLRVHAHRFGSMSLAVSGGFQWWGLDGLEEGLAARAREFGVDGYNLDAGGFGATYGYALEFQARLSEHYFLRTQADWTRMKFETRDRAYLSTLGGRTRTPVSIGYTANVESRPLLFSFGLGRSHRFSSVRWGLSANWIVAPVRLRDEFTLVVSEGGEISESEVTATGIGNGFEALLSLDYFTDTNMTLFVETFLRRGATVVELETASWESSIEPARRRIDFDGGGIRLGFRWI